MMQTAIRQWFLAALVCTLAVPALARHTPQSNDTGSAGAASSQPATGEAANLERKEAGIDEAEHPARTAARPPKARPKTATVQPAAHQQKRAAAGLKTSQLTSGKASNLETKPAALHRDAHQDREENSGKLAPGQKAKVSPQQNKTFNEIHQKKNNARMF